MATLTFTNTLDPLQPEHLGNQIAAALDLSSDPLVRTTNASQSPPSSIIVTHPNVTEQNRTAIQNLINSYVFDPVWQGGTLAVLLAKAVKALETNIAALALPDPTPGNNAYLGHAAIPAGTLALAQLSGIVRILSDQLDAITRQNNQLFLQVTALTRQNNLLIRVEANELGSTSGT